MRGLFRDFLLHEVAKPSSFQQFDVEPPDQTDEHFSGRVELNPKGTSAYFLDEPLELGFVG